MNNILTSGGFTAMEHSFNTFAKLSKKLTFLTTLRKCAYQGVRILVFLNENFACALNEWSLALRDNTGSPFPLFTSYQAEIKYLEEA